MEQKRPRRKRTLFWLILILAILLALLLWLVYHGSRKQQPDIHQELHSDTSLAMVPETLATDTMPKPQVKPDSTPRKRTPIPRPRLPDTVASADSVPPDTQSTQPPNPCAADTVGPWVYPDPSGGLHRGEIEIQLESTEPASIEWKFSTESAWKRYHSGESIPITASVTLQFRAVDTCGNAMAVREEGYEIQKSQVSRFCPSDMEYIQIGSARFCVDRYEWPNRRGARPQAFVSLYQAIDSCFSLDKRLCSTDEWILACSGPQSTSYPYGQVYEPYACVTHDSVPRKSGSRRECRGYFDVYDMSGNLAEWTNGRSVKNSQFFNVMGGFWESGSQSTCKDARYSYYPQNRHNPVGFRCCKDAAPEIREP